MKRRLFRSILLGINIVSAAGPAFAHAHLMSAAPESGQVIDQPPQALSMTFSEGLNGAFSGAAVINADGTKIATGPVRVDGADQTALTISFEDPLAAGAYSVRWHVVSIDGHKTEGSYSFTVRP